MCSPRLGDKSVIQARMGDVRNEYKHLVGIHEGNRSFLEDLSVDGRSQLK